MKRTKSTAVARNNIIAIAALLLALACIFSPSPADAAETYTVYFDTNGGSHVAPYEGIHYNTLIPEPPAPTRQGSVFLGWYMESSLLNQWDFTLHHVTQNLTLYAKWSNLHRIFMEDGSSDVMYARQGERVNIRADSPGWYYTFDRWVSSPSVAFGNRYSRKTYFVMPDRSVTIRAVYRYNGIGDGLVLSSGCAAGTTTAAGVASIAVFLALSLKIKKTKDIKKKRD